MENFKKERLSELISKKDDVFSESLTYDSAYEGLEELCYLLSSLKTLGVMGTQIMSTIKSLQDNEFESVDDVDLIKAQLEVFKRYEFKNIKFR